MPSNYAESLSNMNAMYKSMMELGIPPNDVDNTEFDLLLDLFNQEAKKKKQDTMSAEDLFNIAPGPKQQGKQIDASKFKHTSKVITR